MKTRAVIFDWAGTVVDYGCHAPPAVLTRIFASRGVELEAAESRHAMGLLKLDQIRAILKVAFETAQKRKKVLHNIHKSNVLKSSVLWNEIVEEEKKKK